MKNLFIDEEFYGTIKMSDVNFFIIFLILVLYLILLMVEINYKFSLNLIFIILLFIIIVSDLIVFFIIYEIIFVLIIFSIIILGYSYERLFASFIIIFYSFLFSSPTLIIVIVFEHTFLFKQWLFYSFFLNYFLVGSFIVKFPIFGFHYWLPIAHVEASTVGSILLAGILLKLGSVGLLYVVIYINFILKFHWLSLGVVLTIIIILNLSDLKIIIAYSSVAHISIVFYILIIGSFIGKKGAILIIFYHGFISPLMFWIIGILAWWKTRSLFVVKFISFSYFFLLCLFVLLIINISFPPFIGFISEILILKSLIRNKIILYIFVLGVLFRCYYNIYLFWCFTGFIGTVMKVNFFILDLFLFIILVCFVNFY